MAAWKRETRFSGQKTMALRLSFINLYVWLGGAWHAKVCDRGDYKSHHLEQSFATEEEAKRAAIKAAWELLRDELKTLESL
jgi:hypothetical protein